MQTPRVSIILPAHNVQTFVGEAIASVAAQTYPSFELIIVDDGSTDGTADVLNASQHTWPLDPVRLRVFRQTNCGAAEARNRGIAEAKGALVGFLDADDRWPPETLAQLVATLDACPESDIVCPSYRRIDVRGAAVNYLGEPVGEARRPRGEVRQFDAGEVLVASPAESATGVLVRRDALMAGGGFDAALKSNNDVDCWLRILWTRKSTLVQCPAAVVDYRMRPGQITSSVWNMQMGHSRFLRNHEPLLRDIGPFARMRHFGLTRAYWSLLAARQGDAWTALGLWFGAILRYPRLVLPGSLGSSAAFAIAKAALPQSLWQWLSAVRRRLRSHG